MMFWFLGSLIALGGISGPSIAKVLFSAQVPANEQEKLQGALTSLVRINGYLGRTVMMNSIFAYFSSTKPIFYLSQEPHFTLLHS